MLILSHIFVYSPLKSTSSRQKASNIKALLSRVKTCQEENYYHGIM